MMWWPFGAVFAVLMAVLASMLAPDGLGAILAPVLAFYAVYVAVTGVTGL